MPCTCLHDIVSISDPCNPKPVACLSGLDMFHAPEITVGNLAAMATETYDSGMALLRTKLDLAILLVQNDFISALNTNGVVANTVAATYETSTVNPVAGMGMAPLERGVIVVRSTKIRGKLRKLKLKQVVVYPLTSAASVMLNVYDVSGSKETAYRYNVELVANQENIFDVGLTLQGTHFRVTIDNTAIEMASAPVVCFEGCNGSLPNDCGYARGWDGMREVPKGDGYGINLIFGCECDFTELMCNLSKSFIGQLIWLKARILIMEEHLYSNRFDNWVVYNREDTALHRQEVQAEYQRQWQGLMDGLYAILKTYRDDCIECRGIKWHTNI